MVRIEGRDLFVPIQQDPARSSGGGTFGGRRVDLRRFERRQGELLLSNDLLARHLINLVGAALISANEIELAKVEGTWQVVGVDPAAARCSDGFPRRSAAASSLDDELLDWEPDRAVRLPRALGPAPDPVPEARQAPPGADRRHRRGRLARGGRGDHRGGQGRPRARGGRLRGARHRAPARVHRRSASDADAARLLARMAPDDAADLIMELDQERRLPLLALLPAPAAQGAVNLLSYNPETAGGLMSPDFLALSAGHWTWPRR